MRQLIRRLRIWWLELKLRRLERKAQQLSEACKGVAWDLDDAEFAESLYYMLHNGAGKHIYTIGGGRVQDVSHDMSRPFEICVVNRDTWVITSCTAAGVCCRCIQGV